MAMSLRQLRYFAQIAKSGVMAHAAEDLGVAQSALSHQMSELEAWLGVRLLDRLPRGVALTPAGARLLDHAKVVLAAVDRAEADVRDFTETASGPFRLGLCHTATEIVALPIMRQVAAELPGIHLTMIEGVSDSLLAALLRGELDMAVAYHPPDDSRYAMVPILNENLYLIGLPAVIGNSDDAIAFEEIPKGQVLALNMAGSSRSIVQSQFLRRQLSPHPGLEIGSLSGLKQAMQVGLGCSILARATVIDEISSHRLHARRIVKPELTRTLFLVTLSSQPTRCSDAEMHRIVMATLSGAITKGQWPGDSIAPPARTAR